MKEKIAIPVDSMGILDGHFGHCKFFYLYDILDNKIVSQEKVVPPPHEPGVLPKWLAEKGASVIIAGGMGQRAIDIFNQNGVNVFVGAPQLSSIKLIEGYLNKSLNLSANYCDH